MLKHQLNVAPIAKSRTTKRLSQWIENILQFWNTQYLPSCARRITMAAGTCSSKHDSNILNTGQTMFSTVQSQLCKKYAMHVAPLNELEGKLMKE